MQVFMVGEPFFLQMPLIFLKEMNQNNQNPEMRPLVLPTNQRRKSYSQRIVFYPLENADLQASRLTPSPIFLL